MTRSDETTRATAAREEPKPDETLGRLEASLAELEALVEKLEGGDLPLEQALEEFERGIKLTRECQSVLREAEQKVEILLKDDGEPVAFEGQDSDD